MFHFVKKNFVVLISVLCILVFWGVHQYKKANETDLTKLSNLQQVCEILNLPIAVVYPNDATEHHFSGKTHLGRGVYTVLFRPYVHTKEDYENWMVHLEEASREICPGGMLTKHFSTDAFDHCSDRWYLTQSNAPDANIIISWSDGDIQDGIGMLKLVFEMY